MLVILCVCVYSWRIRPACLTPSLPHWLVHSLTDWFTHWLTHWLTVFFSRCQGQERRISVTLRSTEGELGELIVTVVAALTPVKVAKVPPFYCPCLPVPALHNVVSCMLVCDFVLLYLSMWLSICLPPSCTPPLFFLLPCLLWQSELRFLYSVSLIISPDLHSLFTRTILETLLYY